ncbi:MAG: 30S ribosomal protein S20 [Candidatus Zixiibacteriota bacterium]
MPNHKSCVKRIRITNIERERNRSLRSQLRSAIKDVETAEKKDDAVKKLKKATVIIDKAAARGLIHKKNASRNVSRLTIKVNKLV